MLLSIYVLFGWRICEKKTIFCFSLLPFRCTWKYINAGWKSLKVTVVSVFWSTTSTSTSPSRLNGSRNAKIQMRPQTTSVQRNIRLIFKFVDQESLFSSTLRWLFGSYQSCNNLSTHSIHENFLRFQSCLIFLQVLSLYCIFQERANIAGEWKLWTLHFCCMNKHSSTPSRHSVPKFREMNP